MTRWGLWLSLLVPALALAGGPKAVGWLTTGAWSEGLSTKEGFDAASRVELQALVRQVAQVRADGAGQTRWLEEARAHLVAAWAEAAGAPLGWEALVARSTIDAGVDPHATFWGIWVQEQLRLAQLFPHPTSEVFPLADSDVRGGELPERTFVLTFDDGPTPKGGTTDATLATLKTLKVPGTFFALGEHLRGRADTHGLYEGFCVASHGFKHVPHTDDAAATKSMEQTQGLLSKELLGARADLFRPPYGQRSPGFVRALSEAKVRTILWNVDSQDWRSDAKAPQVLGRVLALMLVQRRGVILFHDVHPVANAVLPGLVEAVGSSVTWAGCERWP